MATSYIGGCAAELDIAHTAADEIGLVTARGKGAANVQREFVCVHGAIMRRKRGGGKRGKKLM